MRVLSGIARFATVLGDKNADCHAPPAVLVRGGSTNTRPAQPAVTPKGIAVCGVCRPATVTSDGLWRLSVSASFGRVGLPLSL